MDGEGGLDLPENTELTLKQNNLSANDLGFVLDHLKQGIVICDAKGVVLTANKAASIFGLDLADLIGTNFNDLVLDPDQARHPRVTLSADSVTPLNYTAVVRGRLTDGKDFPCLLSVSELPGSDQSPPRFLIVCEESDGLNSVDELHHRSLRLELLESEISQFRHELNNLLSIISGSFEITQQIIEDNPEAHKWLDSGLKAVHRSNLLSQELSILLKKRTTDSETK